VVIISKIVLEDRPQLLQKMGLIVHSNGYTPYTGNKPVSQKAKEVKRSDEVTRSDEGEEKRFLATDQQEQKTQTKDKSREGRKNGNPSKGEPDIIVDTVPTTEKANESLELVEVVLPDESMVFH